MKEKFKDNLVPLLTKERFKDNLVPLLTKERLGEVFSITQNSSSQLRCGLSTEEL